MDGNPDKNVVGITFDELSAEKDRAELIEEQLKEYEEKFRVIADQSLFGFGILQDGKYVYMNEAACTITGFSHAEVMQWQPRDYLRLIHPDDVPAVMNEVKKKLDDRSNAVSHYQYRLYDKHGNLKWIENYSKALDYMGKRADFIIFADITERKLIETALRESEEKYRLLVENANDAIIIAQDESFKFANPKTERIFGYSKDELKGMSVFDLIHPEDKAVVIERYRNRLEGKNPPATYSFRIKNRYEEELWVEINSVLIQWEGRPANLILLRDTTAQKRIEAHLNQVQRMEALSTLGGGVAHDFNNLLMGIQGYISILLNKTEPSHPHYEYFREIDDITKSAAELTKRLLALTRSGKFELKPTDMNRLITKSMRMFRRTKKDLVIQQMFEKDIWSVEADRSQIEQVLLNLYVNACDAMTAGGTLGIRTENAVFEHDEVKSFGVTAGRYVKISVTDTGIGIEESIKQKIFEPFFTTKEMGRGTGLGLAAAYGIVKNHKGFIRVDSEKGKGSTFAICLPASYKDVTEEARPIEESVKGTETVLVVDDEETILKVGIIMLESLGYKVLTAKSGEQAIEVYAQNRSEIDLVILDIIMPRMGGREIYDKLKELNPDIRILISSGYSIYGQAEEIMRRGGKGFIQKPFTIEKLSEMVRKALC